MVIRENIAKKREASGEWRIKKLKRRIKYSAYADVIFACPSR